MSGDTQKLLFGVRTLVRTKQPDREDELSSFEERIVIVEAISFEQAIALGEAEAGRYVSELPASWNPELVDDVQAFEIHTETHPGQISPGDEVWSVIRHLNMTDDEFRDYVSRGDEVRLVKVEPGALTNGVPAAPVDNPNGMNG